MAVSLAFFIEYVTTESDRIFRAIFIGAAVFLIGNLNLLKTINVSVVQYVLESGNLDSIRKKNKLKLFVWKCCRNCSNVHEIFPIHKEKLRLWCGDIPPDLQLDHGFELSVGTHPENGAPALLHHSHGVCYLSTYELIGLPYLVWRRPP